MIETIIKIDGTDYVFKTDKNKTVLDLGATLKAKPTDEPKKIQTPRVWLITTKEKKIPLFAVRPVTNETSFRIITTQQLYQEKVQWFEPLANGYRKLLWRHPDGQKQGTEPFHAYKHFSWKEIVSFAIEDRWPISFVPGGTGDWKAHSKGGDGYLLVNMEGTPYWTDAVGQIPFSVDTYKSKLESIGVVNAAISQTVVTGMKYGDGIPVFGSTDNSASYDNFMVLRGALWAAENHTVHQVMVTHVKMPYKKNVVQYKFVNTDKLKNPVGDDSLAKYGMWKK
ncbi:hypothetical protein [Pyxidicoccus trucidator]|uniref:hypothetical protein n=1 Tax=Pyxidicoccus trucidator TaxID=2709662 RepID=UPI0013DA6423|nr:hypothetical protein [Pyxidicoccus trucidator]